MSQRGHMTTGTPFTLRQRVRAPGHLGAGTVIAIRSRPEERDGAVIYTMLIEVPNSPADNYTLDVTSDRIEAI